MKENTIILFLAFIVFSCKNVPVSKSDYFESVTTELLLKDDFSVRAISIDNKRIWYAANNGKFGFYDLDKKESFQKVIKKDSLLPEFRSIAQNNHSIFVLSVGNPALLYKISKENFEIKLVYQENNEKVFYDSMQFWNDKEGIAFGDPIDNCFSILKTTDSGETWHKIKCDQLPKIISGEGGFAASNTNIIVKENKTWIVSGGKSSRLFYSSNKGKTWEVHNTPIVQGDEMTGIFSADFYDENIGFAVGGNYAVPENKSANKALTIDGGKTWKLMAENSGFGYASCVQFVPNSKGKGLVTVGFSGLQYSSDGGETWKQLSTEKDFHTIRFLDNSTAIAAGKNKIVKVFFKK